MTLNSHEALYQYLNNYHHMPTTQLLMCMEKLARTNLSAVPAEYKNQLSIHLDENNANADLFYPKEVANQIHRLARDIQAKL